MPLITLRCPSCGATVELPLGKTECFCEYCGNPVRYQRTEAEQSLADKDREYIALVKTAIASIRHGDHKMATDYADKASAIHPGMPAPAMIKSLCSMSKDFKRSKPSFEIAKAAWSENGDIASVDQMYDDILSAFAQGYLEERDADIRRMMESIRGSDASDIENVRSYECRKRLDDYYTLTDIKDAFIRESLDCMSRIEGEVSFSGQTTVDNWKAIRGFYDQYIYRTVALVFVNGGLAERSLRLVNGFSHDVDLKWGSAFKNGVDGSKDELKKYSKNSDAVLKWLKAKSR